MLVRAVNLNHNVVNVFNNLLQYIQPFILREGVIGSPGSALAIEKLPQENTGRDRERFVRCRVAGI
jgi:hypothetical protein